MLHPVEEAGAVGTTIDGVARREGLPSSQAAVARAFVVECGLIAAAPRRKFWSASVALVEEALAEMHALSEGG